jgi:hypothetical protein
MRHTLLPRLAVCIIITLLAAIAIVPAASAGTTRVGGRYPSYAYAAASRHGLAVYVNGLVKQDYSTGVVGSPRRTVYLQRYVRGGWQPMLRRVTSSSGHVTVGFVSVASYQLRWVVVATASAWGATSRPTRPPAYVPPARTLGVSAATGRLALYYASSRRGAPYRSGGAGPWQFDCSGLTLWSYGRVGRRLPRTADQQYRATIRLSSAQRRAGDLVFFLSGGRSYHTGIYAGAGRLWHAPGAGRSVRLSVIWTSAVAYGRVR